MRTYTYLPSSNELLLRRDLQNSKSSIKLGRTKAVDVMAHVYLRERKLHGWYQIVSAVYLEA
jgi:hypothetical protein